MKPKAQPLKTTAISTLFSVAIGASIAMSGCVSATCRPCSPRAAKRSPCAPCVARNPCKAMNPRAAQNPCAAGDRVDPKLVTRPEETRPYQGDRLALLAEGEGLWNSKAISRNNSMSCSTCHQDGSAMFHPDFAKPYPHFVQMAADSAGKASITLEEMVQLCMIKPMQSKPFAWDSRQLAALTAYTSVLQKTFKPVSNAINPCVANNPCAAKTPCGIRNPCALKLH